MNALASSFGFTIHNDDDPPLSLREGQHFRMYPTDKHGGFGEVLTSRQIDLLRIGMAIHAADGWVPRKRRVNGHRRPVVDVDVLNTAFWYQPATYSRLKACVDFLSGGDDWNFRFISAANRRHDRSGDLFRNQDCSTLVTLYSGGLDSASGLAARLATEKGRMVIPVNLRYQTRKGRLVRDHYRLLVNHRLVNQADLQSFQAGAFFRKKRIRDELGVRFREVTHRCRPILFMSVAGLVADTVNTSQVEVFESGVGSVNVPLISGPANFRTTRSTHPHYLRLISDLVSHVNDSEVRFVLPFADLTKAEMVKRLIDLGLEELARKSVSCILHPLRRKNGRQCGYCPACVFRRQAMFTAGIAEEQNAYEVDLFSPLLFPTEKQLQPIRAFHQQTGRLAELNKGRIPQMFRNHLNVTKAVACDGEVEYYAEIYGRYCREWDALIAYARRRGLAWVAPIRSLAFARGATP